MSVSPDKSTVPKLTTEHVVLSETAVVEELADVTGLGKERITEALAKGAVWLSAKIAKSDRFRKPVRIRSVKSGVNAGDKVLLNYNAEVLDSIAATPELIDDQVNYSIWYKPAGVFSQGSRWGDHCSMPFLVGAVSGKPAYLVHRLDRAASGLMVLAHTSNALRKLTALFAERKIDKTYQLKIAGEFKAKLPMDIHSPVDGKEAHTTLVSAVVCDDQTSLITVNITTGRKHQIRSHLASIGHPVIGDRLFNPQSEHTQDLQLVSMCLALQCPFASKPVKVKLPERFTLQCQRSDKSRPTVSSNQ